MPFTKNSPLARVAGQKGGNITKLRMRLKNPDYYSQIAEMAGEAVKAKYGKDYYSRIGRMPWKRKGAARG